MVRIPANEGQRGRGESAQAPIVPLRRSSKDKLAASATFGVAIKLPHLRRWRPAVCVRGEGDRKPGLCLSAMD